MCGDAQAQQRELTARHVKETEKELSRDFQLQKEQYEATIQRHLAFIDQVHRRSFIPVAGLLTERLSSSHVFFLSFSGV